MPDLVFPWRSAGRSAVRGGGGTGLLVAFRSDTGGVGDAVGMIAEGGFPPGIVTIGAVIGSEARGGGIGIVICGSAEAGASSSTSSQGCTRFFVTQKGRSSCPFR